MHDIWKKPCDKWHVIAPTKEKGQTDRQLVQTLVGPKNNTSNNKIESGFVTPQVYSAIFCSYSSAMDEST